MADADNAALEDAYAFIDGELDEDRRADVAAMLLNDPRLSREVFDSYLREELLRAAHRKPAAGQVSTSTRASAERNRVIFYATIAAGAAILLAAFATLSL